jgi:hypothetical protein
MSLLSALPLLSPKGVLVFQVPGGERGWSDVLSAVRQVGGFSATAVEDERGVKRCLVLRRETESLRGIEVESSITQIK